jgi:hypothetical protein
MWFLRLGIAPAASLNHFAATGIIAFFATTVSMPVKALP